MLHRLRLLPYYAGLVLVLLSWTAVHGVDAFAFDAGTKSQSQSQPLFQSRSQSRSTVVAATPKDNIRARFGRNRGRRCDSLHATGNSRSALGSTSSSVSTSSDSKLGADDSSKKQLVLVLGGSGYIGRRVCRDLVRAANANANSSPYKVVSISRNGKPPSWCLDNADDWSENIEWITHDIGSEASEGGASLAETLESICAIEKESESDPTPDEPWDTTLIGCIGDVNPSPAWLGLWGLGFNDARLLEDNGRVYEAFLEETRSLREERGRPSLLRFRRSVLLSLDYTCQKCLEGPLEGYVDGKRLAEKRLLEAVAEDSCNSNSDSNSNNSIISNNLENVVVIGLPNFVFGGKRFPGFGKTYRKLVESPVARAYVKGNEALRSLSVGEDWVEAMLFSSPVDVDTAAMATAMAARGLVSRDLVNNGEPRKQGFFNNSGLPIEYDDILFVDGTQELETLVGKIQKGGSLPAAAVSPQTKSSKSTMPEPLWEGALIGKRPYLFPIPVTAFFAFFFWGVATQQFVQTVTPV